jgi:hypothetical protein
MKNREISKTELPSLKDNVKRANHNINSSVKLSKTPQTKTRTLVANLKTLSQVFELVKVSLINLLSKERT